MTARNTKYALKMPLMMRAGRSISQKRIAPLIVALALLAGASPAFAQLTPAPFVLQQYFSNTGTVLDQGGMCVFAAGTSTLVDSFTTAAGTVTNANPLRFNSAGRPTTSGFFLTPGVSYKLELRDFTGVAIPSCLVPGSLGTTIWTQDNILAVPGDSGSVELTGTAGESIAAGDAVYLSDGSGARTQGTWYRTDADFTYASSEAWLIGVAELAITSGSSGTMTLSGRVAVTGPLSPGTRYWASATAGALTSTVPTNARRIGVGHTTTALVVGPDVTQLASLSSAYVLNAIQLNTLACGRLTLTSGLPVTPSDVTAATTVYYTPAGKCNQIGLYTSSALWVARTFAELSIAVPATTNTNYDLFVYDNAGTPALELSAAWSNSGAGTSARFGAGVYAALLPFQDGVRVKSTNGTAIDATRRYVGTFRTTGVSGQTESSFAKRLLWNHDNRVPLELRASLETANTWNYSAATVRQANANTANQFEFVIGVADTPLTARVVGAVRNGGLGGAVAIGIGVDSITAMTANQLGMGTETANGIFVPVSSGIRVYPSIGDHYAAWLEWGDGGGGTFTWAGDNNTPTVFQSGLMGEILG